MTHDDRPAVYLHEYTAGGITVRGLVGGLVPGGGEGAVALGVRDDRQDGQR